MGILEFHFHESEFAFEPSMTFPGEEYEEEAIEGASESDDADATPVPAGRSSSDSTGDSGSTAKNGLAVLVGLAFLVGFGAVAKKLISKRRSSGEDDERLSTEKVEESVEIAD